MTRSFELCSPTWTQNCTNSVYTSSTSTSWTSPTSDNTLSRLVPRQQKLQSTKHWWKLHVLARLVNSAVRKQTESVKSVLLRTMLSPKRVRRKQKSTDVFSSCSKKQWVSKVKTLQPQRLLTLKQIFWSSKQKHASVLKSLSASHRRKLNPLNTNLKASDCELSKSFVKKSPSKPSKLLRKPRQSANAVSHKVKPMLPSLATKQKRRVPRPSSKQRLLVTHNLLQVQVATPVLRLRS